MSEKTFLILEIDRKNYPHVSEMIDIYKNTKEYNIDFVSEILNIKSCSINFKK